MDAREKFAGSMVVFPTTTKAFIACQEAGIRWALNESERELAAVIVELINISYREGMEGRTKTVSMKAVKDFFQGRINKEASHKPARIWESVCWWCGKAYQAGCRG